MKSRLLGLLLLVTLGVVKMPLEQAVSKSLQAQNLVEPPPPLSMRESLGQMGFAASLGGLRSLVASMTYLQAFAAFEKGEWGRVDSLMTLTTRLQPREPTYWEDASWHMAYNAASGYLRDESLRAAMRDKLFRDNVDRGIDILKEGLAYLPNNPRLLMRLGETYRDRKKETRLAAETFLLAYANGAKPFYERMGAYELVKLGDKESSERAYTILKRYYDQGSRHVSVLRDLQILEQRLNIPNHERVGQAPPPKPIPRPAPARRTLPAPQAPR